MNNRGFRKILKGKTGIDLFLIKRGDYLQVDLKLIYLNFGGLKAKSAISLTFHRRLGALWP